LSDKTPETLSNRPQGVAAWRWLTLNILLGGLGGLIAWGTAQLLFLVLYNVSFSVASQIDSWLAYAVLFAFVLISAILSGSLGGLAGSLPGLVLARRTWQPSRRWLAGWGAAWIITGVGLWAQLVLGSGTDPSTLKANGWWWSLLGAVISAVYSLLTRPWRGSSTRRN
jgi:hypothetical protein